MGTSQKPIGDLLTELVQKNKLPVSRIAPISMLVILLTTLVLSCFVWKIVSEESRRDEIESLLQAGEIISGKAEVRLSSISVQLALIGNNSKPSSLCRMLNPIFLSHREIAECSLIDTDHQVIETCPNPDAMGELTRPTGSRYLSQNSKNAISKAKYNHSSIYSKPYLSSAIGGPYTDLAIPLENNTMLLGRVSLPIVLRESAVDTLNPYQRYYLLDADEIHTSTIVDDSSGDLNSIAVRFQLAPLPKTVELGLASSLLSSLYSSSLYAWCALVLLAIIICFVFILSRFQFRRIQIEKEMQARIIVQEAMSRSFRDGLTVIDKTGKILYTNKAFEKLFATDSYAYLGKTPPYRFWPENHEFIQNYLMQFLNSNIPISDVLEYEAVRDDGSRFDCASSVFPVISNHSAIGYMITYSDVTMAKRSRQELREMQNRFKRVLETMDAAVSVMSLSKNHELLFANPIYIERFTESPKAHIRIRALIANDDRNENTGTEVFDEEENSWFSVRVKTITWIDASKAEILTVYDITKQKAIEEAIKEQIQKAELSSNLINMGEMTSSLAHELNQPLSAVQNYASAAKTLFEAGKLTPESTNEAFEKIICQTKRAASVMRRIRNFAKRAEPVIAPSSIKQICDEAMELANLTARKYKIKIVSELDSDLPLITCDALLIEQVLVNLLRNASEASAKNKSEPVLLRVQNLDKYVKFSVIDHGAGISPENKEKLFQPFFSTKKTGMGIGLNLCRSIIESHHGHLLFQENPDKGLTFSFTLPAIHG